MGMPNVALNFEPSLSLSTQPQAKVIYYQHLVFELLFNATMRRLKTIDGIAAKTPVNGLISLFLFILVSVLFLIQVYLYSEVDATEHLSVHEYPPPIRTSIYSSDAPQPTSAISKLLKESGQQMKIEMKITFLHLKCNEVSISFDDNLAAQQKTKATTNWGMPLKTNQVSRRRASEGDYRAAGYPKSRRKKEDFAGEWCGVSGIVGCDWKATETAN